jgi:Chromate transporter
MPCSLTLPSKPSSIITGSRPGEMLDGLGMAETTPGPLIMVTQFVGFMAAYRDPGMLPPMLAGMLGGLLTTWVTFTPCFLWIFLGAPFIEALRDNQALSGALAAITAAVVGRHPKPGDLVCPPYLVPRYLTGTVHGSVL